MINISIGGHVHSLSIPLTPRQLSSLGATEQRWKENNIYGERVTCVIISLLPSSSVSFPFKSAPNGSKLTAVVFSGGSLAALCSGTIQYAPDPSLFLMAVPCVLSSEGPSLSPAPRFCCSNVLSAPHITSEPPKLRTDTFFKNKNLRQGSSKAFKKRRSQKCQNLEKRKRDQDVIIPRSVSTFVAGEKATPAVRLSFYSLHKAYTCVHTETHVHIFL